jgi:hypothetical protein
LRPRFHLTLGEQFVFACVLGACLFALSYRLWSANQKSPRPLSSGAHEKTPKAGGTFSTYSKEVWLDR